jgi:hypothetical protein
MGGTIVADDLLSDLFFALQPLPSSGSDLVDADLKLPALLAELGCTGSMD